jgi:hypothetical protein
MYIVVNIYLLEEPGPVSGEFYAVEYMGSL